jgi:hypothetical protein
MTCSLRWNILMETHCAIILSMNQPKSMTKSRSRSSSKKME